MAASIINELNERLKAAMKAKDSQTLGVIRAIRTKVGQAKTAKGFSGEVDDALYLTIIAAYVKSMGKALKEYEKAGERGAEHAAQLRFEIGYLSEFLPTRLDEAATIPLVEAAISSSGATTKKEIGRVMGAVMKAHRDEVDASIVRAIADRLLA